MNYEANINLVVTNLLAGMFNIIFPVILGWRIIRWRGTTWKLFGVGVLTFIGSQILRVPLVTWLTEGFASGLLPEIPQNVAPFFNGIMLGLLAGLFEETARWVGYKLLKKHGDSLDSALTLGAGHGGVEAMIVGISMFTGLISILALTSTDAALAAMPAEQAALLRQQVIDYWALPWHAPLAGAVERVAAVGLHISLSMLVWMAVSRRKVILYFAAVLYHAAVNALATIALSFNLNVWFIEAALLLVSFGVLWMVYRRAKQVDEERKRADAAQAQVEIKPE